MRGEYVVRWNKGGDDDEDEEIIVPNSIVGEGQAALMHALFNRDDLTSLSFEIGLFSEVPAYGAALSSPFTSEPVGNGYARAVHAATGWTIVAQNEEVYAESGAVSFTASGGNFNTTFNRFFLVAITEEPAATLTSVLVSYSSALATAVQLLDTQTYNVSYRVFMK